MRITIDRRQWLRSDTGDMVSNGYLWDSRRKAGCVLGHLLLGYGVSVEAIDRLDVPKSLERCLPDAAQWLLDPAKRHHPDSWMDLMQVNDDMPDGSEMEEDIQEICALNGVEVEFVG